ncbi:MAG: protein kinase [candidate division Zixibacteria bacterium]|nr:protein kinase [candidate division Zixibacteria bacterium]
MIGRAILHYKVLDKIGEGGMGIVYKALDTKLDRVVALKFLPPHIASSPEEKVRFLHEARSASALNHANVTTIHAIEEYPEGTFLVMEYVQGKTLKQIIDRESIPIKRILEIATQACEGLNAAHKKEIVHRDIKSDNIMVTKEGQVKVMDFGLAKLKGATRLTKVGSTVGTAAYMSPEQAQGDEVDQRSDIFSFGVVMYELLTRQLPFKGDHQAALVYSIMGEEPQPVARFNNQVSFKLEEMVLKALAKDKDERYQHIDDLLADLRREKKSLEYARISTQAQPVETRKPAKKKILKLVLGGVAIVVLLLVATTSFFKLQRSSESVATSTVPMIAVLPFENLGDPEDEYFADGITEEITSRLTGVEGLGVISRTSSMQYKKSGKSIRQIGKELGVNYIMEGSVRWAKAGEQTRVRITPQLIRVSDDRHLWADNYEREMMEVFAIQEDIATKIVNQLGLKLLNSNREMLAARPTTNSKAYDYYLKGISGVRRTDFSLPALTAAAANLDSAVMIDPSFAMAYASRSRAYTMLYWTSPSVTSRRIARASFLKALQLEPNLSHGHLAAGIYYNLTETDYDSAMTELNRAFSDLHNDADLVVNIALVQFRQGKFDEAEANFQKATELDPLNPVVHWWHCIFYRFERKYREANQSIDRAIALDPTSMAYRGEKLMACISQYGDWSKARGVIHEILKDIDTMDFITEVISGLGTAGGPVVTLQLDSLIGDPALSYHSLIDRFRREYRKKSEISGYYMALTRGYDYVGNRELKSVYLDSARIALQRNLREVPDQPSYTSTLGAVLAYLGSCKEAVELGLRGKELLSIAKCHW